MEEKLKIMTKKELERKKKTNKGITLIALVITIIVLLILAGISLITLTGENGIFNQVEKAKFFTEYKTVEENINLYNLNSQIINRTQTQITQEELPLGEKISNEEKAVWKNEKKEMVEQIHNKTGMNFEDTTLYWIDFEKIDYKSEHRYFIDTSTRLIFCYEGHKYDNKIHHIPENTEKNDDINIKPEFEIINQYPLLKSTGIEMAGTVKINYANDDKYRNYYSLDDGNTWKEYTGEFVVDKTTIIYAKSVNTTTGIQLINSEEVIVNPRGISKEAYDGSLTTYDNSGKINEGYKYMAVDESAIGTTVEAHLGWYYAQILLLDENERIIYESDIPRCI